jgi:replicative DNA helicase
MKSGQPKVPFPPLLEELNKLFVGGLSLGSIINIASDTGVGKTTIVNELIYYWVFNSPHKVGILSMELDDAQYAEVMLSRHIEKKLALMPDEEKAEFIRTDGFKKASDELFKNPDGSDRFYLVDDRDGSVEDLQNAIEQLIIGANCKVIVIDVLQDVLDGLSNEEQAVFLKWAKSMIKSHGVLFIFINHKRKSPAGETGTVGMNESDIHGSSTIIKSAGVNILMGRDKMSSDEIIRNTTVLAVSKNRMCGLTGPAGALFYVNEEHKLYNFEKYFGKTLAQYLEETKRQ